ncbi:MAG TPA: flavodoxin reductase, partial [Microbacterium sp.]|nr:flavodoxin reductase [Microbacterium sp.]
MSSLTAVWNRVFSVVGRVSMYRLVVLALAVLAGVAFLLSLFGLVGPTPWELLAAVAVLAA